MTLLQTAQVSSFACPAGIYPTPGISLPPRNFKPCRASRSTHLRGKNENRPEACGQNSHRIRL